MPSSRPPPPLPVTIVVRNFFPPLLVSSSLSSSSSTLLDGNDHVNYDGNNTTKIHDNCTSPTSTARLTKPTAAYIIDERYTLASRRVLRQVRLDIIAQSSKRRRQLLDNTNDDYYYLSTTVEANEEEVMMYSSTLRQPSSHPRWDHVDEGILDTGSTYLPYSLSSYICENDNVQQQLRYDDLQLYARFLVLVDDDEDNTAHESSHNNNTVIDEVNDGGGHDCSDKRQQLQQLQQLQQCK